jgi:hypothetical protein
MNQESIEYATTTSISIHRIRDESTFSSRVMTIQTRLRISGQKTRLEVQMAQHNHSTSQKLDARQLKFTKEEASDF